MRAPGCAGAASRPPRRDSRRRPAVRRNAPAPGRAGRARMPRMARLQSRPSTPEEATRSAARPGQHPLEMFPWSPSLAAGAGARLRRHLHLEPRVRGAVFAFIGVIATWRTAAAPRALGQPRHRPTAWATRCTCSSPLWARTARSGIRRAGRVAGHGLLHGRQHGRRHRAASGPRLVLGPPRSAAAWRPALDRRRSRSAAW
ncbi:MAG: hypothetical protein MZW92_12090 [Comamonadaceae bacterium]|nr:hypothetical protein [Comamonadaceae bacterium]